MGLEPIAKPGNGRQLTPDDDFRGECEQLRAALPAAVAIGMKCVQYQAFWYPERNIPAIISFQRHFQPLDADIFLATKPKCGTTWLKALAFAIVHRHRYPDLEDHPLHKSGPHELVPFIDATLYNNNLFPDLTSIPSPRLFATHLAFESLPESVKTSNCPVIYMCRNPLDAFASGWHFFRGQNPDVKDSEHENGSLEVAFDKFCQGIELYGPFLDHVLGYWKASRERPNNVLFLMYEDVKQHPNLFVKKIAEFMGCPFSAEEESAGKIEQITMLCSFQSLKDLEINKNGTFTLVEGAVEIKNKSYFRKGEVGDWVNLLSPSMMKRYDDLVKQKLEGSGLMFGTVTSA